MFFTSVAGVASDDSLIHLPTKTSFKAVASTCFSTYAIAWLFLDEGVSDAMKAKTGLDGNNNK